jgi:hypothetical protein
VTLEQKSKFAIGIDRDSAVRVDTNGKFIVTGGRAIVVHPAHATIHDGPLGITMNNLTISLLSTGDIFNPADASIKILSSKNEIVEEDRTFNGGFLITDIGSGYAVATALIGGLAENSQESQTGIVLQYHDNTSHGYRYEFRKDSTTKSYHADSLDGSLYSMLNVRLEIAPIANGLHPSSTQSPIDLGDLSTVTQNAIKAVAFRGILPTNSRLEFQPGQIVTRREFAIACVRSVHLNTPPKNRKTIIDIAGGQELELEQAFEAG